MSEPSSPKLPERKAEFKHLAPCPFAPLFIEKLLLAIIEANPAPAELFDVTSKADVGELRLHKAMFALFGTAGHGGDRRDIQRLARALEENLWDESDRQLAKMAGKKSRQMSVPFSKILGLEAETQTSNSRRHEYVRLLRKHDEEPIFKYLHELADVACHEEEKAMETDLHAIAAILRRWNVDLDLDPVKIGLLSRTHS
jgi:hypothetical protein